MISSFHLHASFFSPLARVGHRGATLALGSRAGLYCNTCFAFPSLRGGVKGAWPIFVSLNRSPSQFYLKRRLFVWPRTQIRASHLDSDTDAASEASGPSLTQKREDTEVKLPSSLPTPTLLPPQISRPLTLGVTEFEL